MGASRRLIRHALLVFGMVSGAVGASSSFASDVDRRGHVGTGPVVVTADGAIRGYTDKGVNVFLGIPYAEAPVGDLRWQPPQAVKVWRGTRDATKYGGSCPQVTTLGLFAGPTSVNEDCLYLNVFTTGKSRSGQKKPVIVWIHGGGNIDGASNDYDGTKLSTGGPDGVETVVVTLNYRLGVLGTFSHPAVNSEGHAWGNYGTLDQQAALRWVQRNIERFGGDPGRVALGGQSAGAYNVGANLLSPSSKGLFNRAIMQSSPGFVAWLPTAESALATGTSFATAAGCPEADASTARCLRRLSVARILQLQGTLKVGGPHALAMPFVDGTILPMQPEQAWTSGRFNKMPVLGGATKDEAAFFTGINEYFSGPPQTPITAAQYSSLTASGAFCIWCNADRKIPAGLAELYPLSDFGGDASVAYERIGTDGAKCRDLHVMQKLAPQVPTYAYDFTYQTAPFYFPKMPGYKPTAVHTIDIQFLFDNFHGGHLGVNVDQMTGMPRELNAAEEKLSDHLVAAWTHFADTGNPNGTGDAPWPKLTADDSARYFVQAVPISTISVSQYRAAYKCDFFDAQLKY
ncbi:carboxylesterase family protein [Rhodoferax sediminis]|uniref:Carboxylic ester hydrolase n=2 Tax=Rhodoferax sediminis TaxID=2509614 RepID=A0A515DHE4_9BURK|nr:carboxylesterase family protein [Rhodoferax sediminis]